MLRKNSSSTFPTPPAGVTASQATPESTWSIFSLAAIFLIFAHLCVKTFFPNPAFWFVGAGVICVAGIAFLKNRHRLFGFLLALFVCVHFAFADNQGGLWSYVICSVFLLVMLLKNQKTFSFESVPRVINWLILVFFTQQCLGLLLNPYSFETNLQSLIVSCSQILVFYSFASIFMSPMRVKLFFSVWFLTGSWVFFMALNQRFHWIITPSPLLPQFGSTMSPTPAGSFGNSELFAEYFCLIFVISLNFIVYSREMLRLHIKPIYAYFMFLFAVGALIMSSSRSAILLSGGALVIIFVMNAALLFSAQNIRRTVLLLFIVFSSIVFILAFGSFFSLERVNADFERLDPSTINFQSVVSGKGINRSYVYDLAHKRLDEESWWIGYGYGIPKNNRMSLGLTRVMVSDFHSLYLSLPIFYGWLGAAAYILLVIYTSLRAFRCFLRNRRRRHYMVPFVFSLAIAWGIFLADQFIISVTRNATYFLLTWILLGLTHSMINALNYHVRTVNKSMAMNR
ncbi:MAG: O-antigen ligase family protein [Candidatus Aminicenantes bacterium]|nr:O-antigen ligase family protein [Candidatus Aminicenantes bacterium]